MLYFFCGTNEEKAREKLGVLLQALIAKKPDASVVRVRDQDFDPAQLPEYIGGQGLFESKQIVVLDHVCVNSEIKEALLGMRKDMAESPNLFFILEGNLDKATGEKFKKVAEKFEVFGELGRVKKEKEASFNSFALGDALGARDRKLLWVLLQEGRRADIEDEALHGTLFWSVKNMVLATEAASAEEAGINPFVYRKVRGFIKNYSSEELRSMLRNLTALPHEARRGRYELGIALERFVLSV